MLLKLAKGWLLIAALSGLCTATHANTTVAEESAEPLAETVTPVAPDMLPTVKLTPQEGTRAGLIRIAVLLPLRSATLGVAADAVRAGIQAAYERENDGIAINIIETDGSSQEAIAAYVNAVAHYDIVIGPLSRSEVSAVAQSDQVNKPTIALAPMELVRDAQDALPPKMLAMGLSIEDEARQVAKWIASDKKSHDVLVISTNITWQSRVAKAFSAQWHDLGFDAPSVELELNEGYFSASSLAQLKKQIPKDNPPLLFVALDAVQATHLRLALGDGVTLYGISQLNSFVQSDVQTNGQPMQYHNALNGVRLLDIPWQLQPDHPAVMIYPRLLPTSDQQGSPDMARLYALGIDAYRAAREIGTGQKKFTLDGVTGKLSFDFGRGPAHFERIEQPAIYQGGVVVPLLK